MEHDNQQTTKEPGQNFDFELPEVKGAPATKPRIHQAPGESTCVSCEG